MESNGWLVLVTAGLSLDIAGIIILSQPLLAFNRKTFDDLMTELRRTSDYLDHVVEDLTDGVLIGTKINITNLQKMVKIQIFQTEKNKFDLILSKIKQEEVHHNIRKNVIIALIIISIGFFLQIIGNAMK